MIVRFAEPDEHNKCGILEIMPESTCEQIALNTWYDDYFMNGHENSGFGIVGYEPKTNNETDGRD